MSLPTRRTASVKLAHLLEAASKTAARATRAAEAAEGHERMIGSGPPVLGAFHESRAALLRSSQARHLAVIDLYRHHARILSEQITGQGPGGIEAPRFIDTLAAVTGLPSVCVGLRSPGGADAFVASDPMSRVAHDCETLLGEGPVHTSQVEGPLLATEEEIRTRWAHYAAAIERLGVRSVATVPLRVCDLTLGSMTALGTKAQPIEHRLGDLCTIGDAVVDVLVAEVDDPLADATGLIGGADYRDHVHQAAGMVSVQYGCSVGDALALLRAHAFAAETDLHGAARAVMQGDLRFERP